MALDQTAGNVALGQLSNMPFDNIIGGPLNAAINAQAQAAETTVNFIHSVGLEEINGRYEAITVQFTYEDATGFYRKITVPILAIVPIPFIVIDEVGIAFKARISASAQQATETKKSSSGFIRGGVSYRGARVRAHLYGGYSAKKDSKASQESKYSVEYTMDVNVHASQAGITQGMEAVLNFLQEGTHNVPENFQGKITNLTRAIKKSGTTLSPASGSFLLYLNDASGDVVTGLTDTEIIVSSEKGYFVPPTTAAVTDGDGDGNYTVLFVPAATGLPTDAGIYDDVLRVEVTSGDNVAIIERPVTLTIEA